MEPSSDFIIALRQFANNTTDSYIPFNLSLNWVVIKIDMHVAIRSES